ncbi:MAG: glycosyltransferase family 2 protein [Pyrinomonadaceae bacterium]
MLLAEEKGMVVNEGRALSRLLAREFAAALNGHRQAQACWRTVEGGAWSWQPEAGLCVNGTEPEWSGQAWWKWDRAIARTLKNFLIEVTISGQAEAAGLSFGPFKDFLAGVNERTGPRRLQLEIDATAGQWVFRVDGQFVERCWWNASVNGVEDLLDGVLTCKAKRAEKVWFSDLNFLTFEASCRMSVIIICQRFLQRLRVSLHNWCQQVNVPAGVYEVIVVNPRSADGTREHLSAVARSYPQVRVREIAAAAALATNKGALINRAVAESRGAWVWLTDADCVFAPRAMASVLSQIEGQPPQLGYGQRRYLNAAQTSAVLAGRDDALRDFAGLAADANTQPPDNAPWGYTQIVPRSIFERVRYREELNHFAHSDGMFTADCERHGLTPRQLPGLFCLHLHHPFAWYGTDAFL